jgi:hypothetical protein
MLKSQRSHNSVAHLYGIAREFMKQLAHGADRDQVLIHQALRFGNADGECGFGVRIAPSWETGRDAQRLGLCAGAQFLNMDHAKRLMQGVGADAKALEEKLNLLAQRKMTRETITAIFDRLFPKPKEETSNTARRENVMADVLRLYESNDKNTFPQIRGSAYNLLNAVTEYTDHERSARITDGRKDYSVAQARAENALVGTGDKLKTEALEVILQSTNGAPLMTQAIYSRPIAPAPAPTSGGLLDSIISAQMFN